jgi:hypothetical protein
VCGLQAKRSSGMREETEPLPRAYTVYAVSYTLQINNLRVVLDGSEFQVNFDEVWCFQQ